MCKCVGKTIILFLLFSVSLGFSQESSGWYYDKPIRNIRFEGLDTIRSFDLDGIKNQFIGKNFSDEVYLDLINRLYALDYFDDISPEVFPVDEKRNSLALVFTVKEKPVIKEINYSGNKKIKLTELKNTVTIKTGDIFNEAKMRVDERAIFNLYLQKGYTNVKVVATSSSVDGGVAVNFTVTEGKSTVLTEINFQGNTLISSKTLSGILEMKPEGKLFSSGHFQEATLESDKTKIIGYYFERGYIDAKIIDVIRTTSHNEAKDREDLAITFVIEEGEMYTYGGLTIVGNEIFSSELLASKVKLQEGKVFNYTKMQEGLQAIADTYYESGYTSNSIEPVERRNNAAKQISYTLNIVERPRSHIEQIRIQGNTRTKDYVILRDLGLQPGDVFSKERLMTGLRNLYNLQFFSAVAPDIVPGSEENLIDLVINVEEQSTTTLEFGLTFSGLSDPTVFPLSVFAKWQDSNLMGTGKTVAANVTVSPDTQEVGFTYADYWLAGIPLWTSVNFSFSHATRNALQAVYVDNKFDMENYYMDYNQWNIGLSGSLGYRWYFNWAIINLQGGLSLNTYHNVFDKEIFIPIDASLGDAVDKWGMANTISASVSLDGRDVNYDPHKGWFLSERIAWTGVIPGVEDQFYMRNDLKLEGYVPICNVQVSESWAFRLTLATFFNFSFQLPPDTSYISSSRQLYIDGMFAGRGWSSIYNLRGQALMSGFAELRWPFLPGIVAADFFFDFAALKPKLDSMVTSLKGEDFYMSFGPGLRFALPQFPLRLLFANTFRVRDGAVEWRNGKGPDWNFVLSFNMVNK